MRTVFSFNSLGSDTDGLITVCLYSSSSCSSKQIPAAISHVVLADSLPLRFEFVNISLTPVRFKYFVSSVVGLSGVSMLKRASGLFPSDNEEDDLFNFLTA